MSANTLSLETPLGELIFTADAVVPQNAKLISLKLKKLQPVLPSGMEVMACYGILVQVESEVGVNDFKITAALFPLVAIQNGAETGEGLEAQGWSSLHHIVMVGTEDSDWLVSRLGTSAGFSDVTYDYTPQTFSMLIPTIIPNVLASFHMVVAWNPLPEPKDCSCWYSVDRPHADICEAMYSA